MRRTKIVATVGPASRSPQKLEQLVPGGRQRLSPELLARQPRRAPRGDDEVPGDRDAPAQAGSAASGPLGPKIRTGKVKDGVEIVNGARITITTEPLVEGDAELISTTYEAPAARRQARRPRAARRRQPGAARPATSGTRVECEVVDGGPLRSNKGINLPGVALSTPALTEKDRRDLAFGVEHGVDFIALSFVRQAQDLEQARELVSSLGAHASLIAKIEKPQALDNLEAILAAADGVMVARGDLGVELGTENVPIAQKRIIAAANNAGPRGDHRDPDAREHDREPAADARRGFRRRQRHPRRDRRGDAVGRERRRQVPGRDGRDDGAHRALHRGARRELDPAPRQPKERSAARAPGTRARPSRAAWRASPSRWPRSSGAS
jgi:pyruvate kinase